MGGYEGNSSLGVRWDGGGRHTFSTMKIWGKSYSISRETPFGWTYVTLEVTGLLLAGGSLFS